MAGIEDDIKELREEFQGIDRAIIDGAKNMRSLQATLSKTNAVMGSKNWEVFSRFISGTGLWRVQNRIRATVILLNEMASTTERRRLEEVKQLKVFAEIADQSEEIKAIQENIEKAEKSTGKTREDAIKTLKGQSQIFGGLLFQYQDSNKALKEMSLLMNRQTKDMEKLEKIATKTARRRKEGLITNSLTFKIITGLEKKMKSVFGSTKGIANTKLTNIAEAATDAKEGFFGISEEEIAKRFEAMGRSESDKDNVVHKDGKRTGKIGNKFASEEQIQEFNELVMLAEESRSMRKKAMRKTADFFKFAATPLTNIANQMVRLGGGILKVVRFMAMAAGYLLILMLGLTILREVFMETKDELAAGFATIKEVFSIGMAMVSEGVGEARTALQEIFTAFQNTDVPGIFMGVGNLLLAGLKILGGLLVATLGAVLAGIGTYISELYTRFKTEALTEFAGNVKAAVLAATLRVIGVVAKLLAGILLIVAFFSGGFALALIAFGIYLIGKLAEKIAPHSDKITGFLSDVKNFLSDIWSSISTFVSDIVTGIVDGLKGVLDVGGKAKDKLSSVGSSIADKIPFLSTGGLVTNSGVAVVGERGPELVQLPRGAQVHSNSASKAMASSVTNHITVQVTGRVGASDTEIRDIANKVAREINSRMNRTSTSVVKF